MGSGGVIVPPEGYLERIREIWISMESYLFLRSNNWFWKNWSCFCTKRFNVTPDIITWLRVNWGCNTDEATAFKTEIYDEIVNGPDQ
ncbi:MAG: hypothetical protein Ct9H300mP3_04140 [Gammaproteobacteria bacterium]|nr:MAG: hypothetical protein Ct9H300mP3_04140 [Gammaproteobacteria bacterium]